MTPHDEYTTPVKALEAGSEPATPVAVPSTPSAVTVPLLPLRNTVLFPHLFMPLSVGRPSSLAAIEAALATEEKTFIVAAQRENGSEQPGFADLYTVGTRAVIKKMARTAPGAVARASNRALSKPSLSRAWSG